MADNPPPPSYQRATQGDNESLTFGPTFDDATKYQRATQGDNESLTFGPTFDDATKEKIYRRLKRYHRTKKDIYGTTCKICDGSKKLDNKMCGLCWSRYLIMRVECTGCDGYKLIRHKYCEMCQIKRMNRLVKCSGCNGYKKRRQRYCDTCSQELTSYMSDSD